MNAIMIIMLVYHLTSVCLTFFSFFFGGGGNVQDAYFDPEDIFFGGPWSLGPPG